MCWTFLFESVWLTCKKQHNLYYFTEISPQGCFSNKPSFKKEKKEKVNLFYQHIHPELLSFETITTPPVALCIRLPLCSVAQLFSHRQKRIILSQQYLGTLKAPYSPLDWHVWPGGLQVTCLVSRHLMMSGKKMRTYAALPSNDWVCRKPLFHLAGFWLLWDEK